MCTCNPIVRDSDNEDDLESMMEENGITQTEFLCNIRSRSNIDMGHCWYHLVPRAVEQLNLILD